ncbi:MAG: hypothetical protein ISR65_15735 [Bacteriovoracaceae bacterium]|nr:hypothetical protein [Bacteriovoracaceae bacterium]
MNSYITTIIASVILLTTTLSSSRAHTNCAKDLHFFSKLQRPKQLDFIEFDYEGINFRAYGILHGVTGGLNATYRRFVNDSIEAINESTESPFLILAEKGMSTLYPKAKIDAELDDWLVLRPRDAFVLGLQLMLDPQSLRVLTIDFFEELLRKSDPFEHSRRFEDLGGSPFAHALTPQKRRDIAGFPAPLEGLEKDLERLSGKRTILPRPRKNIPHPAWARLLRMERVMHIPARSLHMLNFAAQYAKSSNATKVALLVGETHNSDMAAFAKANALDTLPEQLQEMVSKVSARAKKYGKLSAEGKVGIVLWSARGTYITSILLGSIAGLSFWMAIGSM